MTPIQAIAQLDSITAMVRRLEHARECSIHDECRLSDAEIADGLGLANALDIEPDDQERYHDEDDARQYILENALEVSVRSGWHSPGEKPESSGQFLILLCTGGPAVRIVGELSEYGESDSARIEHQDWGTPWTRLGTTAEQDADLLTYAAQFYFGGGS